MKKKVSFDLRLQINMMYLLSSILFVIFSAVTFRDFRTYNPLTASQSLSSIVLTNAGTMLVPGILLMLYAMMKNDDLEDSEKK